MRKLLIRHRPAPVMTVAKSNLWARKMVYVVLSNRRVKYPSGSRSRILYIGTTKKGSGRPAANSADKAMKAFKDRHLRGVKNVEVHILTCKARRNVKTWLALESALLATFRAIYWSLPHFNKKTGEYRDPEEVTLFRGSKLRSVIKAFER